MFSRTVEHVGGNCNLWYGKNCEKRNWRSAVLLVSGECMMRSRAHVTVITAVCEP